MPAHAAILSVGDELTLGQNLDTNSAWLASQLAERSIMTLEHRTLADDRAAIALAIAALAASHDVLCITGGLGPTEDDLTREALGDVAEPGGAELVADPLALEQLRHWFERRGRPMPEMNRKQALRPRSMRLMDNPNGTAPGLAGRIGACHVFAMPGPPREMQPMFLNHVLPALDAAGLLNAADDAIVTAMVQEFGMGESVAAERLGHLMDRTRNPLVGTTASDSIITARVRGHGSRAIIQKQVQETIQSIERAWHPYDFGRGDQTLADAVGQLLLTQQRTLAVAESCTGGWLGKTIVDRAGSSAYFRGGWITYSDQMKIACLGVEADLLRANGAVSEPVAMAMARGALHRAGADEALSITGIAGPDGDRPGKPVGNVCIGLARRFDGGEHTIVRRFEFTGERAVVRDRAVKAALQMLRFALLNVPADTPLLWEAPAQHPATVSIS